LFHIYLKIHCQDCQDNHYQVIPSLQIIYAGTNENYIYFLKKKKKNVPTRE
jgi:hypothetical protein